MIIASIKVWERIRNILILTINLPRLLFFFCLSFIIYTYDIDDVNRIKCWFNAEHIFIISTRRNSTQSERFKGTRLGKLIKILVLQSPKNFLI